MAEIKLQVGKMDLEQDPSSKDETVSAILYNAFRHGKSFKRVPGFTESTDIGTQYQAYMYFSSLHNVLLAVCGSSLYTISQNGVATEVTGGGFSVNTPASFAEDSTRILIAANSAIHVYTVATGVLTQLGGQAPLGVTSISILRGFLIANGLDGGGGGINGDFGWSNDASYATWSYENNAANPDGLQAIVTIPSDDIFFIGKQTIEVNNLSGSVASPFYVNKPASQSFGTPAPYTVAYDGQNVYMLTVVGNNRQIMRLNGGRTPQLIGFPVNISLDEMTDISDMRSFIFGIQGRTFYVITSQTARITIEDVVQSGFTLAFDIREEEWHVWGSWNSQAGEYNEFKGCSFAYAESWGNKRYIGGFDGKIYLVDNDSYTFNGSQIRMALRTGYYTHNTTRYKGAVEYTYDIKQGVGNSAATSPLFEHRYREYKDNQWIVRRISMGASGSRSYMPKSRLCGRYQKRQHELVFPDAVEVIYNGIYEDVRVEK